VYVCVCVCPGKIEKFDQFKLWLLLVNYVYASIASLMNQMYK